MKVVLDTNVVIGALLSPAGAPAHIVARWESQDLDLVVSEPLLQEYRRALMYERVAARHGMSQREVDDLVEGFRQFALLVEPEEEVDVPEDPDDAKVLECAMAGSANCVVSGDGHLLRLREYRGIPILSPAAFLMAVDSGELIG